MPVIFVDANIILGFWSLGEGRVPSDLLLPLVELRDYVLMTRQIAEEVSRNKLSVFLKNSEVVFKVDLPMQIPDHMSKGRDAASFNENVKSVKTGGDDLRKSWAEIRLRIASEISAGTDLTTQMLAPLLKAAREPTTTHIAAARDRWERGNPPGKKSDPIGDQISWEQYLDVLHNEENAWIITRDQDFAEKIDSKNRVLNPFLRAELTAQGIKNVYLFDSLAEALKALKAAGIGVARNLGEDELDKLAKEEVRAHIPNPPYLIWPDEPWQCPLCRHVNTSTPLIPRPSSYGGWSYWTTCVHCGSQLDTGEAYDD